MSHHQTFGEKMKYYSARLFLRSLPVAIGLCSSTQATADPLAEAEQKYAGRQVAEAERLWDRVAADPRAKPIDRAQALRRLAIVTWRIRADLPTALAHVQRAVEMGDRPCASEAIALRILGEAGLPERALGRKTSLPLDCAGRADDAQWLAQSRARAALDAAASMKSRRIAALDEADRALASLPVDQLNRPDVRRLQFESALLRGDAGKALSAWRAYYLLGDEWAPKAFNVEAGRARSAFQRGVATGGAVRDQAALAMLLARGGFYHELRNFLAARGLRANRSSALRPVLIYLNFRREIDDLTTGFNRAVALGLADRMSDDNYDRALREAITRAEKSLTAHWGNTARATGDLLLRHFGVWSTTGPLDGVWSLRSGHIVEEARPIIQQFGQSGRVSLYIIDSMLANGFNAWLTDGAQNVGGWADTADVIFQVRSPYIRVAFRVAALRLGQAERARREATLTEEDAADLRALSAGEITYAAGLATRLRLQAVDQVEATLGADKSDAAFARAWREQEVDRSILVHEGRHVLDQAFYASKPLGTPELEFRAKLSELRLGRFPRAAFANINTEMSGDGSPHEVSNKRILAAYVGWIEKNSARLPGYAPATPAMLQIHLLTDQQIRDIAATLDPEFR
jgi:hypothetical protein